MSSTGRKLQPKMTNVRTSAAEDPQGCFIYGAKGPLGCLVSSADFIFLLHRGTELAALDTAVLHDLSIDTRRIAE